MKSGSLVWIDQIDLGSSDLLRESRRHLDFLRSQLRATGDALDEARACIDASWELLAELNRTKPREYPDWKPTGEAISLPPAPASPR